VESSLSVNGARVWLTFVSTGTEDLFPGQESLDQVSPRSKVPGRRHMPRVALATQMPLNRMSIRFHVRKRLTTWSPLTESNRRPSPYHETSAHERQMGSRERHLPLNLPLTLILALEVGHVETDHRTSVPDTRLLLHYPYQCRQLYESSSALVG
jgi:hypothetical protein